MFDLSPNGIIQVTRGDSFSTPLFINKGTDLYPLRYILKDGEYVYFGLMEPNYSFEKAIVRKKYSNANFNENDDVVISFDSEDTMNLLPGKYYYEVKVVLLDENEKEIVNTIIPRREFWLLWVMREIFHIYTGN